MSYVNATLDVLTAQIASFEKEIDTMYLLFCGALVILMQAGFAMLEAGSVKSMNVRNVLFKNLADACIGGTFFWFIGYGFAYGGNGDNGFIGDSSDGGKKSFAFRVNDRSPSTEYETAVDSYSWITFFFQYAFAAAATTIVSGAVAGRTKLVAYLTYSVFITGFVYPVVVHWVWDYEGWISAFNEDDTFEGGMIDFAGSGVVHMTGGVAALVGAIAVGPRKGRFDSSMPSTAFNAHSAPLQVLGTFILWFGWYGFNCGSTLGISAAGYATAAARSAVTTTLAAVASGLSTTLITKALDGKWDLGAMCNGVLAGLVSITAGCSVVETWAAFIIGIIGGLVCVAASRSLVALGVDDPLDAFAVHGACGAWGCIAVGLFACDAYTYNLDGHEGIFYGGSTLLGIQLLGVLTEFLWVGSMSGLLFFGLSAAGMLRISDEEEETGLDLNEHEGPAYIIVDMYGGPPPMKKSTSPAAVKPSE